MSSESELKDFFGFHPNTYTPPTGLRLGEEAKQSWENRASGDASIMKFGFPDKIIHIICQKLKEHLQAAVSLELSTIPLYLYAAYSIKSGSATDDIIRVVREEMLHLALAGNILCSVGGKPLLYWKTTDGHVYVPEYPAIMLYQKIKLSTMRANKCNIQTFVELESPEIPLPHHDVFSDILDHYKSIGAFYNAIEKVLELLNRLVPRLFIPETFTRQYKNGDGSWRRDSGMTNIENIESAKTAIQTIVVQGEGSTVPLPPNPPSASAAEKSHYQVFKDLFDGPELDCYAVLDNPKTKDYKDRSGCEGIYKVLLACDAVYCYLLITVENMWDPSFPSEKRPDLINKNLHKIMGKTLKPMAKYLREQPVPKTNPNDPNEEQKYFLPFFNFYQFSEPAGSADRADAYHNELKQLFVDAIGYAPELKDLQAVVDALLPVAGYFNPNWKS